MIEPAIEPAYAQLDDPDFDAWFKGSKAADATGHPVLVFRGEHGARDGRKRAISYQTRRGSIAFGDVETAIVYATSPNDDCSAVVAPRVVPAYLDIQNPLVNDPDDPFVNLSTLEEALGRDEAVRIAHKFEAQILDTGFWVDEIEPVFDGAGVVDFLAVHPERLGELYFPIHCLLDDAHEVALLRAVKIDGAIHCGFGENGTETEYRVFHEGQIAPAAPWLTPGQAREFAADWEARRAPYRSPSP